MNICSNKITYKTKSYIVENWGSPFIIAFTLLLVGDAFSSAAGLFYLADSIAIYAFYALVVGVILQLVCVVKYGKEADIAEAV